jgi:hypothetical protein
MDPFSDYAERMRREMNDQIMQLSIGSGRDIEALVLHFAKRGDFQPLAELAAARIGGDLGKLAADAICHAKRPGQNRPQTRANG